MHSDPPARVEAEAAGCLITHFKEHPMAVIRIDCSKPNSSFVKELWSAPTVDELIEAFEREVRNYPVQGYGTDLAGAARTPDGSWNALFSRYTSCD